jgi:hypothetical protein
MEKERRKHPRCRLARDDAFVLDHDSGKVATLMDLSLEGMQLSYLPDKFTCGQWNTIDIFIDKQNHFLIAGLACEVVYDAACLMENSSFSSVMDLRICGIRFNRLTDLQREKLGHLISGAAGAFALTT